MTKLLLTLLLGVLLIQSGVALDGLKYPTETQAVQALARKYSAKVEYQLWDKTRVDLLNPYYAIEADWSHKWAEGIGQALYYSSVTGRKPAVLLLVKDMEKERRYIYRCQTVCNKYDIKLYIEKVKPLQASGVRIEAVND